jgi:hypothetical protein
MDATFKERAAALQEQLSAPEPVTWRPDVEDGDVGHPRLLIGELVAVQEGRTSYGQRQIAILRDAEGQLWNVWLMHHVLIDEFVRQQPKRGEMLAISYDGRVDGGQGTSGYAKFRLVVDRKEATVSWRNAEGVDAEPERPTPPPPPPAEPLPPAATAGFAVPATVDAQPELGMEPVSAPVAATQCDACLFYNGNHADGCPNDIPF